MRCCWWREVAGAAEVVFVLTAPQTCGQAEQAVSPRVWSMVGGSGQAHVDPSQVFPLGQLDSRSKCLGVSGL